MLPGTETLPLHPPGEKCITQSGISLDYGGRRGIAGSVSVHQVPTRPTTVLGDGGMWLTLNPTLCSKR